MLALRLGPRPHDETSRDHRFPADRVVAHRNGQLSFAVCEQGSSPTFVHGFAGRCPAPDTETEPHQSSILNGGWKRRPPPWMKRMHETEQRRGKTLDWRLCGVSLLRFSRWTLRSKLITALYYGKLKRTADISRVMFAGTLLA